MTFSPLKAGAVTMRTRISCTSLNIWVFAAIFAVRNAVEAQGPGSRSAALVERGDEAGLARHLRHHLIVGHGRCSPKDRAPRRTARALGMGRTKRGRQARRTLRLASTEAVRSLSPNGGLSRGPRRGAIAISRFTPASAGLNVVARSMRRAPFGHYVSQPALSRRNDLLGRHRPIHAFLPS